MVFEHCRSRSCASPCGMFRKLLATFYRSSRFLPPAFFNNSDSYLWTPRTHTKAAPKFCDAPLIATSETLCSNKCTSNNSVFECVNTTSTFLLAPSALVTNYAYWPPKSYAVESLRCAYYDGPVSPSESRVQALALLPCSD